MKRARSLLFTLLLASVTSTTGAQTLTQAKNWYSHREYQKAIPVFKKQITARPKDPSLNLMFGACLIETGKYKEALPYLEFAKSRSVTGAYLYLSKYFFLDQKPDSAQVLLNHYLALPITDHAEKELALELSAKINATLSSLRKVEDLTFIDSLIVPKTALYNSLKLTREAGSIAPVRSVFPMASKAAGCAFLPEKNDRALFADAIPEKGLDLVTRHRLLNEWDNSEPLSDVINTQNDEFNPWLLSDGTTLYFASNRPGGYGEYDLYVTRMGKNGTYLLPDRLNKPLNSSANDYFLIIDEFANRGYLATDRNQSKGFACIYTFIPNTTTVFVEGKSLEELQNLADIKSIRDTWKGKNMDSLLVQPKKTIRAKKKEGSTVVFIINDMYQCSSVDDFVSPEASQLFETYTKELNRKNETQETLQTLRSEYLKAEAPTKALLTPKILQKENELQQLATSLPELESKIRGLELKARTKKP
jgi:hypothetical protein